MKLGVCLESMGVPIREGMPIAARLGVQGLQVNALGEFAPTYLGETGRRELRNMLRSYALSLTALQCPLRRGLDLAEDLQPRIDYIRQVMALAFEMGPRVVVIPLPKLPTEEEVNRAQLLRESLADLGRYGDRIGTLVALEIGLDPPEKVLEYLQSFDLGSLKINYDPANLVVNGIDPIAGLLTLNKEIVHFHARDARRSTISQGAEEVALGAGDIDWLKLVATLASIEYHGWLTLERHGGDSRLKDITNGVAFLKRMVLPE
jgi:L-ribulose-5-phosphate 3-epimerase